MHYDKFGVFSISIVSLDWIFPEYGKLLQYVHINRSPLLSEILRILLASDQASEHGIGLRVFPDGA